GDEVDTPEQLEQLGAAALDPEVHRVAGDELRPLHLREHVELQARIDVPEEHERRAAKLLGDLGSEVREDTEVRLEGLSDVQIVAIAAAPSKGATFGALEPSEIDAAF